MVDLLYISSEVHLDAVCTEIAKVVEIVIYPPGLDMNFRDYDKEDVYDDIKTAAEDPEARNFLVEFGPYSAKVARDFSGDDLKTHLKKKMSPERPVRWINFWQPGKKDEEESIELLRNRYDFSPRLVEVITTEPPPPEPESSNKSPESRNPLRRSATGKFSSIASCSTSGDIEMGVSSDRELKNKNHYNFYGIAKHFTSYHSIDVGDKFICVGANWMQPKAKEPSGEMLRTWAWFILCHDSTVISFHEKLYNNGGSMKPMRHHMLSVLKQLSEQGRAKAVGIEKIGLRYVIGSAPPSSMSGSEGASNLFYYLFDNWASTLKLLQARKAELKALRQKIMAGLDETADEMPAHEILPGLSIIEKHLRSNQHLYKGYENLVTRILKYDEKSNDTGAPNHTHDLIRVSHSACNRFERLQDHINYLVLNYLDEAIGESESLSTTYFNIYAQKDSKATGRLSSSAATLSKLGVLFLPVSLMTGYFSVQIEELEGVYTTKTYWVSFAVIMVLSFLALFLFSSLLNNVGNATMKSVKLYLGLSERKVVKKEVQE